MTDQADRDVTQAEAEAAVRTLIRWAGDDPDREGVLDTPARVARSYRELFAGYDSCPRTYLERTSASASRRRRRSPTPTG